MYEKVEMRIVFRRSNFGEGSCYDGYIGDELVCMVPVSQLDRLMRDQGMYPFGEFQTEYLNEPVPKRRLIDDYRPRRLWERRLRKLSEPIAACTDVRLVLDACAVPPGESYTDPDPLSRYPELTKPPICSTCQGTGRLTLFTSEGPCPDCKKD